MADDPGHDDGTRVHTSAPSECAASACRTLNPRPLVAARLQVELLRRVDGGMGPKGGLATKKIKVPVKLGERNQIVAAE